MIFQTKSFDKAVPIWAEGKTGEKNCSLWFETQIAGDAQTVFRIAGCNDYQVFVNGRFCFYGPARAGRGYYRVDEIDVGSLLTGGQNRVEVLVNAYRVDSFCFLNEEGFFCAEFLCGNRIFGETGSGAWRIREYSQKIRKTQRYSYQRPFAEVYDYRRTENGETIPARKCEPKRFIDREVPYPAFEREAVSELLLAGSVKRRESCEPFQDRAIIRAGKGSIGGFTVEELEVCSVWEAQELELCPGGSTPDSLPQTLPPDSYIRLGMTGERTGFIRLDLFCKKDADLFVTFDEILTDGRLDFTRMECSNVVMYRLRGGEEYHLVTAQPYSLKFMDVICLDGEIDLTSAGMIRLDFDEKRICRRLRPGADPEIRTIYSAAVETFRQNTVDLYMDCPSRERAGWLCDSFFTSRVEALLTGKSTVEHAFLSNFVMEDRYYRDIPDGMLPMCYPSEHAGRMFIPNWAMWYVLELEEYLVRTGDRDFVGAIRDKLYRLLAYFERFENAEGLLEKLEGWVFVEWSHCNDLVQDINYPTNMLYYAFLKALAKLYEDSVLEEKAEALKQTIRKNSRLGVFFCDNAVYENGTARLSGECTESCQYYAFFTGVADAKTDAELWNILVHEFGPQRKETGKNPEIAFSNAFIGNYLRCELLMKNGLGDRLEKDLRRYFLGMAQRTGTLWEHDSVRASCNHGFASHVLVWLDALGYIE